MRIREAGEDAPAAEVDDIRAGESSLVRADPARNAVACDRQRALHRHARVHRANDAVPRGSCRRHYRGKDFEMIDHVALNVSDHAASKRLLRTVAGPARVRGRDGPRGLRDGVRRGREAEPLDRPQGSRRRRGARRAGRVGPSCRGRVPRRRARGGGPRNRVPVSDPTTTSTTTAPSCLIRTATTSKPSVTSRKMQELRPGLSTWTALHPSWTPKRAAGWDQEVRSYVYDSGDEPVLFDPLAPPPEIHVADARVESSSRATGTSAAPRSSWIGSADTYTLEAKIDDVRATAQAHGDPPRRRGGTRRRLLRRSDALIPACGGS